MNYTKFIFIFSVFFATNIAYSAYLRPINNPEMAQNTFDYALSNNSIKPFPNSKKDNAIKELVFSIALNEIYFKTKYGHKSLLTTILQNNYDLYYILQMNNLKLDESYTQELFSIYEQTHQDYMLLTPVQIFINGQFIIDYNVQPILSHRNNPLLINITPTQIQSNKDHTGLNDSHPYKIPPQPIIDGNL